MVLERDINVIITGYPKSGNTWITRLVAEILKCHVRGFWGSKHKELAIEGEDRRSKYCCFKAHQQLKEFDFKVEPNNRYNKIIYVLRDPRDITISGAHFFSFEPFEFLKKVFKILPAGNKLYFHLWFKHWNSPNRKLNKMIKTVLYGDKDTHLWCKSPWKDHVLPFYQNNILIIKYEDMLLDSLSECKKICAYLNVKKSDEKILKAIDKQSFTKRKKEFQRKKDKANQSFLRSGKIKQWEEKLSKNQKRIFKNTLKDELLLFNYPL